MSRSIHIWTGDAEEREGIDDEEELEGKEGINFHSTLGASTTAAHLQLHSLRQSISCKAKLLQSTNGVIETLLYRCNSLILVVKEQDRPLHVYICM